MVARLGTLTVPEPRAVSHGESSREGGLAGSLAASRPRCRRETETFACVHRAMEKRSVRNRMERQEIEANRWRQMANGGFGRSDGGYPPCCEAKSAEVDERRRDKGCWVKPGRGGVEGAWRKERRGARASTGPV